MLALEIILNLSFCGEKVVIAYSLCKIRRELDYLDCEQLILKCKTRYFSKGSIIADSRENAGGLMVVTAGQVGVELPMDSPEADEEHRRDGGSTLLYVLTRG